MDSPKPDTINSRGVIPLIYSTTTGTSKKAAQDFQAKLQDSDFVAPVFNIGDYPFEELSNFQGTIIFFLATYGNGQSPDDGEKFTNWIQEYQLENAFSKLSFAILAFGNSSFQNHCGFGVKTQCKLVKLGAKPIRNIQMCDAGSKDNTVDFVFQKWANTLLQILKQRNPLREMSRKILASNLQATFQEIQGFNWQQSAKKAKNACHQFTSFIGTPKCQVLHIKELRRNTSDGRSTLWVRIKLDPSLKITPACNINIFPLNLLEANENDSKIVKFKQLNGKVPFSPLPLRQLRKIVNLSQTASRKHIKDAWLLSTADVQTAKKYEIDLQNKKEFKITCKELVSQLKPKVQFYPQLGLNLKRAYTLASWTKDNEYIDLCVSLVKDGLTSNYLKSYPETLRITTSPSTFYIPEKRPLVLIANGSGIAPFRSIVQYYVSQPSNERPHIRLYYGIQNEDIDFYFDQEWRKLEEEKIVQVRLAQSRKDPAKKQYVQDILEKDIEFLHQHLFAKNGVIFICGGASMAKSVASVLFKVYAKQCKIPYKAYGLSNQLRENKTVVEEVFG